MRKKRLLKQTDFLTETRVAKFNKVEPPPSQEFLWKNSHFPIELIDESIRRFNEKKLVHEPKSLHFFLLSS